MTVDLPNISRFPTIVLERVCMSFLPSIFYVQMMLYDTPNGGAPTLYLGKKLFSRILSNCSFCVQTTLLPHSSGSHLPNPRCGVNETEARSRCMMNENQAVQKASLRASSVEGGQTDGLLHDIDPLGTGLMHFVDLCRSLCKQNNSPGQADSYERDAGTTGSIRLVVLE